MKHVVLWMQAVALCWAFAAAAQTPAQEPPPGVPEPEGYRMENYHAPTPATLKGATVVDTPQAFDLWTRKAAVFIDAIARPKRPADLPPYQPWSADPRRDIPGSIWLADTGFGELTPEAQRYFETGLARATGGDKSKPISVGQLVGSLETQNALYVLRRTADDLRGVGSVVVASPRPISAPFGSRIRMQSPLAKPPSSLVTPAGSRLLPFINAAAAPASRCAAPFGASEPAIHFLRA